MAKNIANRGQVEVLKEREHYERDSLLLDSSEFKRSFHFGTKLAVLCREVSLIQM